jgi:4-hydroxybenzoate polyprenyltransferase
MIKNYVAIARPRQHVKNLLVFAPLFFSGMMFDEVKILSTFFTFVLFSIAASSIYILNDLKDVVEDKNHPTKKYRPIASGKVSKFNATLFANGLFFTAIGCATFLSQEITLIITAYLILNVFYSFGLKHIPILDVSIISIGFVLRIYGGVAAISAEASVWIVLMTFLLAMFLALAKRRDDVLLHKKDMLVRVNISGYNLEFINAAMTIMASVVVVAYISYTISDAVQVRLNNHNLYLTVFFVIIGMLRYLQITFVEKKSGSPTDVILTDVFLQVTVVLWLVSFGLIIYSSRLSDLIWAFQI